MPVLKVAQGLQVPVTGGCMRPVASQPVCRDLDINLTLINRNSAELKGTRSAERTKTDTYEPLCQQLGIDFKFVPIILTASGGIGEQFQRQH